MLEEREVHLFPIVSSLKGWRRRSSAYVGVALAPPSILNAYGVKPFTLSGECIGMLFFCIGKVLDVFTLAN